MIVLKKGYASLTSIIVLGAVCIVVIPMFIILLYAYNYFFNYFKEQEVEAAVNSCNQINLLMEKEMFKADRMLGSLTENRYFKKFLKLDGGEPTSEHMDLYQSMDELVDIYLPNRNEYVLVFDEKNYYSSGNKFYLDRREMKESSWYKKALERTPKTKWLGLESLPLMSGKQEYYLSSRIIVDVDDFSDIAGVVYVTTVDRYEEILNTAGEDKLLCYFDPDGQLIFNHGKQPVVSLSQLEKAVTELGSGQVTILNDYIGVISLPNHYGYRTLMVFPKNSFQQESFYVRTLIPILFVFLIILFIIFMFFIVGKLLIPLQYMVSLVNRIQHGETDIKVDRKLHQENLLIAKGIVTLAHQNTTIGEDLDHSIKEKEKMELSKVQAQINPHFIYNTLTSIKYMAMLHDQDDICNLITKFVNLLRNSINRKGHFITLDEEIENLNNYIHIQKVIYHNSITFLYNICDQTRQCIVPNFILQPLVENCILHGILSTGQRDGIIKIESKLDDQLYITIEDNGCGSDDLDLHLYNQDKKFNGMGIHSVNKKVQLLYSEAYGLHISSQKNHGTLVTINLPIQYTEE